VANFGAFQRTIDKEGFSKLADERGITESVALRRFVPEDLPASYGVVQLIRQGDELCMQTFSWTMEEGEATGKLEPDSEKWSCRRASLISRRANPCAVRTA
jgi:hypothetical protein